MDADVSSHSDCVTNVLFTLRADRNLLDPTFDRYILRTEKLAMFKQKLDDKIRYKLPSDSQWGYQQIRAHTLASHLFFDHFASAVDHQLFFVFLDDLRLIALAFDRTTNRWSAPVHVASVGTSSVALSPSFVLVPEDAASSQSFPESLHFVDSRTAVTARGLNTFSVWDTGDRRPMDGTTQKWREIFHYELPPLHKLVDESPRGVCAPDDEPEVGSVYPALILDARRMPTERGTDAGGVGGGISAIDLLLLTVEPTAEKRGTGERQTDEKGTAISRGIAPGGKSGGKNVFRTHLIWVTVHQTERQKRDEDEGEFVVRRIRQILCDGKVEFACFDAAFPHRLVVFGVGRSPQFVWDSAKPSPISPLTPDGQKQRQKDDEPMETQQPKETPEHKDIGGGGAEEISLDKIRLSAAGDAQQQFNSEQLEECDRPPDVEDDVSAFWLDGDSHEMVAMTIVNELLFAQKISPGGASVFATRYDVDAIVWQHRQIVSPSENKSNAFVAHLFTLNAFGYIQAGHQDKRFLGCSPDGRYAALINRTNHCFLYFQNSAVPGEHELKNRRTGKRAEHIAKQLVLSMSDLDKEFDPNDSSNEFIAFNATPDTLFLLTRSAIYAVEMPK